MRQNENKKLRKFHLVSFGLIRSDIIYVYRYTHVQCTPLETSFGIAQMIEIFSCIPFATVCIVSSNVVGIVFAIAPKCLNSRNRLHTHKMKIAMTSVLLPAD